MRLEPYTDEKRHALKRFDVFFLLFLYGAFFLAGLCYLLIYCFIVSFLSFFLSVCRSVRLFVCLTQLRAIEENSTKGRSRQ